MSELGQMLRKARMDRGISLDELQETTKIRKRYLEAIEDGSYKVLPGNFYVRAFIKSYAEAVGLDPEEVLRLYRNVIPAAAAEQPTEPVQRRRRRTGNSEKVSKWASGILMVAFPLLIIGIIYYYFYWNSNGSDKLLDDNRITDKMEETSRQPEVIDTEKKPDPPVEQQETNQEPEKEPVKPDVAFVSNNPKSNTDLYKVTNADKLTVEMRIIGEECWFQINKESTAGESIDKGKLVKDDTRTYSDITQSVWINFGRGNAVELKVNGILLDTGTSPNPHRFQIDLVKPL